MKEMSEELARILSFAEKSASEHVDEAILGDVLADIGKVKEQYGKEPCPCGFCVEARNRTKRMFTGE